MKAASSVILRGGSLSPNAPQLAVGLFTTEYNIPNATSYPNTAGDMGPFSITAGPDGNIWFTERVMNTICKISPKTDNITEYYISN